MDDQTNAEQLPPNYVIEIFTAGPGVKLTGAAAFLSRCHAEGMELVTAYAVPHPTGNMILHHFVLRRREPAALAPGLLSEEDTKAIFASLVQRAGELMPLEPSAPKGGQRKR